jgi:NADPH:quinone reductase-like Zn-dependent oxidoreductase
MGDPIAVGALLLGSIPDSAFLSRGAGGTGIFAIQFAKHSGAHIVATASRRNHEILRALGVDEAFDPAPRAEVSRATGG